MERPEAARMPDRAPMLFSSAGNFAGVGEEAVTVGAVGAIDTLHDVQIREPASIEDKIIRSIDLWNAVYREANRLVNDQEDVE